MPHGRRSRREPATRDHARPRAYAYAVHVLTAAGILFLFLAAMELTQAVPRPALVLGLLLAATLIDSIDGPLAREFHVKRFAPEIDGRKIDDIVDYLGFTFIPLLLVWRMAWVPGGEAFSWVWIAPALVTSLFGFANLHAKDEARGYFRGFPSYWNIAALYFGLLATYFPSAGPWINGLIILLFSAMTVAPVWFLYPNRAPRPWRWPLLMGGLAWAVLLVAMLPFYPGRVPGWLTLISLIYPMAYLALSLWLRRRG